jgi:hypothetical protein
MSSSSPDSPESPDRVPALLVAAYVIAIAVGIVLAVALFNSVT